jgi:transmembrane sensor
MRMKITKEQVIAFFEDRSSRREVEAIYWYLAENPQLLHDFFSEEEWLAFKGTQDLPGQRAEEIWETIQGEKHPVTSRVRPLYLLRTAAAVVAIAVGSFIYKQYADRQPGPGVRLAAIQPAPKSDTLLINRTEHLLKDTLTDGSVVELSPASTLGLHWNFDRNNRSVRLSGEALFDVTKDAHRPFTVITRGFTTTVLGTVFRIKAYAGRNMASIRLLKGKVLVRNLVHPTQEELLLEGQACAFDNAKNNLSRTATDRPATHSIPPDSPQEGLTGDSSLEETDKEILFKHLPLPNVLAILSKTYHTPIFFTHAKLRHRNFTGSVQKDHPIEDALNAIAQLNDLLVTRQDSSYRITLRR